MSADPVSRAQSASSGIAGASRPRAAGRDGRRAPDWGARRPSRRTDRAAETLRS